MGYRLKDIAGKAAKVVVLAGLLSTAAATAGCGVWRYRPPIPTDLVGWRYTQHNYLKKTFTRSTSRAGNVQITTTTRTSQYFGRRTLNLAMFPDHVPPITQANLHLLRAFPGLLDRPFRSVDGQVVQAGGEIGGGGEEPGGPPTPGASSPPSSRGRATPASSNPTILR